MMDELRESDGTVCAKELTDDLKAALASRDYASAAAIQKKIEALSTDPSRTSQERCPRKELHQTLKEKVSRGDYEGAATVKAQLRQLSQAESSVVLKRSFTVGDFRAHDGPLPERVMLQGARIAAIGRLAQVPGARGKNKGKAKGKDKSGKKGDGKAKSEATEANPDTQAARAVYFRDDNGYTICTMAYGEDVKRVPSPDRVGARTDIGGLRVRPGQKNTLVWTSDTRPIMRLEREHTTPAAPQRSPLAQDWAAWSVVSQTKLGDHVSVPLEVLSAEEKYTRGQGEPYLEVGGRDHEGNGSYVLRMWSHVEGDVSAGHIYMFHGLKVSTERVWDDAKWQYVAGPSDGERKLDCDYWTAVEKHQMPHLV